MLRVVACTALLFVFYGHLSAEEQSGDWPNWRGPHDNGGIEQGDYPTDWTADEVLWKVELPGKGCSTPIVLQRRIYVTAPIDGVDALLAFDWSGEPLWQAAFGKESPGKHRNGSGSNASPATDGESIFVYFKSGTLAAVDLDGEIRWQTNLIERFGPDTLFWDHGTSPVPAGDYVIMTRLHQGESWVAAFDKASGELKWKAPRNYETPVECDHGYATPLVIEHDGEEALLVWGAQHLTLHDLKDGSVIWSCGNFNPEGARLWPTVASPVVAGGTAVVAFGRNDQGTPRLHGVRLGGAGDVTETHRVWDRDDMSTFVPTPAVYRNRVYIVGDHGNVTCIDPADGETVWSDSFGRHRSKFYASPLIAGGKLYAAREDGTLFVADIREGFKLLAEIDMGDMIIASPVAASGRLLIRGTQHLYCIGSE